MRLILDTLKYAVFLEYDLNHVDNYIGCDQEQRSSRASRRQIIQHRGMSGRLWRATSRGCRYLCHRLRHKFRTTIPHRRIQRSQSAGEVEESTFLLLWRWHRGFSQLHDAPGALFACGKRTDNGGDRYVTHLCRCGPVLTRNRSSK